MLDRLITPVDGFVDSVGLSAMGHLKFNFPCLAKSTV